MNQYWQIFSHYLPAIILDGLSMITGSKPRYVIAYHRSKYKKPTLPSGQNRQKKTV